MENKDNGPLFHRTDGEGKVWWAGGWIYDSGMQQFKFYLSGFYPEPGHLLPPPDKVLGHYEVTTLVPKLEENGYLKPRLDERLRTEDLKITHRLLDLLEMGAKK